MTQVKQNFNTIDVFNPYLGSALEVPRIIWKPGTTASYNIHVGKTSVSGLWQGTLMVGWNPDSLFSYLGSPGNINFHWPSITCFWNSYHEVVGASTVFGAAFSTTVAVNRIVGAINVISGTTTTVTGANVNIGGANTNKTGAVITANSTMGLLTGFWTYNGSNICAPCPSDRKAKTNIVPLVGSLSKILKLQGVSFDWNKDVVPKKAETQKSSVGLIAQEVEEVIPEVVVTEKIEGNSLRTVQYENLVSVLIEGMKEQQQQIEELKQRISDLESTEVN